MSEKTNKNDNRTCDGMRNPQQCYYLEKMTIGGIPMRLCLAGSLCGLNDGDDGKKCDDYVSIHDMQGCRYSAVSNSFPHGCDFGCSSNVDVSKRCLFLKHPKECPQYKDWRPPEDDDREVMRRFLLQFDWHTGTPPESGKYLVTYLWGETERCISKAALYDGVWYPKFDKVLAWMPLPEPYAGEEEHHEVQ